MIEEYRRLGEEILKKFDNLEGIKKKREILNRLTNEVNEEYISKKGKGAGEKNFPIYEIIINFDINNDLIEIKKGEQIKKINKFNYFTFSPSTSNGKKISFTTNKIKYHQENTIIDLIKFIEEDLKNDKKFIDFKNYLLKLKTQFYVINDKKYSFNLNKIKDYNLNLDFNDNLEKILGIPKKEIIDKFKVFSIYINNKNILDTEYKNDYIELKFIELIDKYFSDEFKDNKTIKEKKISHISGKEEKITREISIFTKFYITDKQKSVFFENFNNNNSYKAFTCSKEDYIKILLGIKYIRENLKIRIQDLDVLLVPKSNLFFTDINLYTDILKNDLNNLNKINSFNNEDNKLTILNDLTKNSLVFDLMFYEKGQNDFNIFKIISSLSLKNIGDIKKSMYNVFEKNNYSIFKLNIIKNNTEYLNKVSFNSIWNSLYFYISKKSGKDNKIKLYRTEFLNYLNSIFNKRKINEMNYIKTSMKNLKYGFFQDFKNQEKEEISNNTKVLRLSNMILNIFNSLQFFENLGLISYEKMENKKNLIVEKTGIEKLDNFFELHQSKFGLDINGGSEKQGLIILGYLINKVVYEQKDKSKTFINLKLCSFSVSSRNFI